MSQQIRGIPFVVGAAAAGLFGLAPPTATGQMALQPNVIYMGKPMGDCGAVTTRRVFSATVPPAGGFFAGPGPIPFIAKGSPEIPTKGAPYSAVGTTETVQTLADGNRIVHTNTMRYFRDGSGRTRTEYSLSAVGPFTLDEARSIVMINDPIAGQHVVLHPAVKRAEIVNTKPSGESSSGNAAGTAMVMGTQADGAAGSIAAGPVSAAGCAPGMKQLPPPVSLGEKTLGGLKASGTRVEYTIAAGEIGNEQPIIVRSEQWRSEELGVVLSSTQHDPMIGDTTYHLDQIERSEPDPALFTVPSDYTVQKPFMIKAGKVMPFGAAPPAAGAQSESK
jgi:hypothetical protein